MASRYMAVEKLINRVAVSVGLDASTDVVGSTNPAFIRLVTLFDQTMEELFEEFEWGILRREFQHTTDGTEPGYVSLPNDFGYMIPQTGWERSENVPLLGPVSPQTWTHLLGRDLVGSTIYASFRFAQDRFYLFPDTNIPVGWDLNFEYISRNWLASVSDPGAYTDEATENTQIAQLPPRLVVALLKKNYLEATGFGSQAATTSYLNALDAWKGKDNSAPVLSASRRTGGYAYIDPWRNIPDTGFGR